MCVYVYIYIYTHLSLYIYRERDIYTYIERERATHICARASWASMISSQKGLFNESKQQLSYK